MATYLRAKVFLIEDDPLLGPSLKDFLEARGFEVYWSQTGEGFNFSEADLIILDLILPKVSGEELLEQIKQENPQVPVLVLTAKGALENKKECFEKGADDYLVKPFEVEELLLRIEALLRRTSLAPRYHIGPIQVDLASKVLRTPDGEIFLSRRAWDLLLYLLRHQGKLVTKEEILKHVWQDAVVTEDSVRAYIKELRKVLPKGAIKTFKGRGYLLS